MCPTFGDLAGIRLKWSSTLFKKMSKDSGYELTSRPQIISNGKWGEAEGGRWRHVKRKALPTINLDVEGNLQGANIRTWIQCLWLWQANTCRIVRKALQGNIPVRHGILQARWAQNGHGNKEDGEANNYRDRNTRRHIQQGRDFYLGEQVKN